MKYFTTFKQLLVSYYRVVYSEDGYFTWPIQTRKVPKDAIQPTAQQVQAIEGIIAALRREDEDGMCLKHAVCQDFT